MKKGSLFLIFVIFTPFLLIAQEKTEEALIPVLAPFNQEFIQYQKDRLLKNETNESGRFLGYIPEPFEYYFGTSPDVKASAMALPSVYDLRTAGPGGTSLMTSIKNQGNCGSCWAFAAIGSLESNWLKNGYGNFNLSENNLKNCHGFAYGPCDGGNFQMASAYLTRLSGPVAETSDPYSITSDSCISALRPGYYVSDTRFFPKDNTAIKQAIIEFGGLSTYFRYEDASFNEADNTYYYSGTGATNHGVVLAGWDDNKVTAGGTGAWIVKNSWGSNWGENGYFYLSYNDTKVNATVGCFPVRNEVNKSTTLYDICKFGNISAIGYSKTSAYALIKFTGINKSPITRIGTYANASNTTISIEIYDNFTGGTLSGLLGSIGNQTCAFPGYYTFPLASQVGIPADNDFYVKIYYLTTEYNYPIPLEVKSTGYCDPEIETGRCWMSSGGTSWTQIGTGTHYEYDVCIRAMADNRQLVSLTSGWNILSANLTPDNRDMKTLFQPFIDDSLLLKVQDETGNTLEDYGVYGGWVNNMDSLRLTEGYKVKVSGNCQLNLGGIAAAHPLKIPLKAGWNIIGYPNQTSANAQSVVQQLINRGKLIKVQDEKGNSIEDYGVFGGWVNTIGNFLPGEGYKVKLNATDTLTISESYTKSGTISLQKAEKTTHFQPVTKGNGVDHMNINIVCNPGGFLQPGDEIGIYDGNLCVGSTVICNLQSQIYNLKSEINNKESGIRNLSIAVSASDGLGSPGFAEGHPFTLKLWKSSEDKEYSLEPEIIKGTSTFKRNESTLASLENLKIREFENLKMDGWRELWIYPNPTDGKVYIISGNRSLIGSHVRVVNTLGQVILDRILDSDRGEINISGNVGGLYYITVTGSSGSKTEKLIIR